jgi:hypothetical protein
LRFISPPCDRLKIVRLHTKVMIIIGINFRHYGQNLTEARFYYLLCFLFVFIVQKVIKITLTTVIITSISNLLTLSEILTRLVVTYI